MFQAKITFVFFQVLAALLISFVWLAVVAGIMLHDHKSYKERDADSIQRQLFNRARQMHEELMFKNIWELIEQSVLNNLL